jgi:hypothetical protein
MVVHGRSDARRAISPAVLVAAWGGRLIRVQLVAAAGREGLELQVQAAP